MATLTNETDQYRDWFHKSKRVFDSVYDLDKMQRLSKKELIKNYTEFRHPISNRTSLLKAVCEIENIKTIQLLLENYANPFATTDDKGILH